MAYLSAILLSAANLATACEFVNFQIPTSFQTQMQFTSSNRPIVGATIELYIGQPSATNDLPYESLVTDSTGKAITSSLSVATYSVRVRTRDGSTATFTLDVPVESEVEASDHKISLSINPVEPSPFGESTGTPMPSVQRNALEVRLGQFRGTVADPRGAVIAGVQIEVHAAGAEGRIPVMRLTTDSAGKFAANLEPGDYVAFFLSQGFVQQKLAVSIVSGGWQGVLLEVALGGSCGPEPAGKSRIAELK